MNSIMETCEEHCSGCGLCEVVCPVKAISMEIKTGNIRPIVNNNCVSCGKCKNYCPNLSNERYSYNDFQQIVWGHSLNQEHRLEAASGGITSELLAYLVNQNIVDYIITADEYHSDQQGSYFISNGDGIFARAGSNYCPMNIGNALNEIREKEGTCAIVCLPCLARGIKQLCMEDETLNSKIKYIITLLCNHVPSYNATEYLKKKYRTNEPDLIKYRGNGWFGFLRFFSKTDNGSMEFFSIGYSEYFSTGFSKYFWQNACILCEDHFGKYADIAMGDADFVKYRTNDINDGETICFINNLELNKILMDMREREIIFLEKDVSGDELKEIYGSLCEKRASAYNLEQDYNKILRLEKRDKNIHQIKTRLNSIVGKVKRGICNGR